MGLEPQWLWGHICAPIGVTWQALWRASNVLGHVAEAAVAGHVALDEERGVGRFKLARAVRAEGVEARAHTVPQLWRNTSESRQISKGTTDGPTNTSTLFPSADLWGPRTRSVLSGKVAAMNSCMDPSTLL